MKPSNQITGFILFIALIIIPVTASNAQTETVNTGTSFVSAQLESFKAILEHTLSLLAGNSQVGSVSFAVDVEVITNSSVNVYDANTGEVVGDQPQGATGEINKGPRTVNGTEMWKINFHKGRDGWVAKSSLNATSEPVSGGNSDGESENETSAETNNEPKSQPAPEPEPKKINTIPEDTTPESDSADDPANESEDGEEEQEVLF